MKSIQTGLLATALAATLLLLAPLRIQAQGKAFGISLTATYQLPDVTTGPDQNITTSLTKSIKWTSGSILNLASNNLGMPLKGYTLTYDPIANVVGATNGRTGDFQDLTGANLLTVNTSGAQIQSGSANSDTGKRSETSTTYTVITFDDGNGNAFTVSGLIRSISSQPAPTSAQNDNGIMPNETILFSGNVSGFGTVGGNTAVFSGAVSGGGSGQGS